MKTKRILAYFLAFVLALSLLPAAAIAAPARTTHTVRFDANFVGEAPDPIEVPDGSSLAEVCANTPPVIADEGQWRFAGWSESGTRQEERYDLHTPVTADLLLFAVWEYELEAVDLFVQLPTVGNVCDTCTAYTRCYDVCGVAECLPWWDDASRIGDPDYPMTGTFEAGKTYYSGVKLRCRDAGYTLSENTPVKFNSGVTKLRQTADGETLTVYFSVIAPQVGQVTAIDLFLDEPIVFQSVSGNVQFDVLSAGVAYEPDGCWWRSLADVGDYDKNLEAEDGFLEGQTYYGCLWLFAYNDYNFAQTLPEITFHGGKVESLRFSAEDELEVIFSLTVRETGVLTVAVAPYAETEPHYGGAFQTAAEPFWQCYIDAPFYPGHEQTITAKAREGYRFDGWYLWLYDEQAYRFFTGEPTITVDLASLDTPDGQVMYEARFSKKTVPDDRLITEVEIAYTLPEIGTGFDALNDRADAALVGDAHCTITRATWYNHYGVCPEGMTFEAGEEYFLGIDLTADEGYAFAEDVSIRFNGEDAGYAPLFMDDEKTIVSTGSPMILFQDPAMLLHEVDVTITLPEAGKPLGNTFTVPEGSHYTPEGMVWFDEDDTLLPPDTVAVAGKTYQLSVSVRLEAGYSFAPDVVGRINGKVVKTSDIAGMFAGLELIANYTVKTTAGTGGFLDVPQGQFYSDAVEWAVSHEPQITKGVDATHFAPDNTCTRGQIVTFLWRAKGCPEPSATESPFVDVQNPKAFYYKAVLWAVEKGVTTGIDKTHFGPDKGCTRGQVVAFLWRAEDKPAPSTTTSPFEDVQNTKAFYYDAVLWAVEKGITKGVDKTHFGPDKTCTRGQIVTFLYRDVVG